MEQNSSMIFTVSASQLKPGKKFITRKLQNQALEIVTSCCHTTNPFYYLVDQVAMHVAISLNSIWMRANGETSFTQKVHDLVVGFAMWVSSSNDECTYLVATMARTG